MDVSAAWFPTIQEVRQAIEGQVSACSPPQQKTVQSALIRAESLVMASVFGDESSDETRQRVFAVAGLEGTESEWRALEGKWLARTGGKEFHAADCESEYASHPDRQKHKDNQALYADLAQLIANSGLRGFGVAMDLAGHREFFTDVPQDISYMKCSTEVLKHFIQDSTASAEDPLEFTFDHRQESEYNAGFLYSSMVNWNEWKGKSIFLSRKISFDSRKNPRIQAADLLARETMKHLDNMVGPIKRPTRKSMEALTSTSRIAFDFLMREYFQGWFNAMPELQVRSGFTRDDYGAWLKENKLLDNISSRIRFLIWTQSKDELG